MERPQDNQVIEISNLTTYQQTGHIETKQLFLKTTQGWFEQQQQQSHACRETFNSNMHVGSSRGQCHTVKLSF